MTRIISALLLFACCAWSQTFEVASIRLHRDGIQSVGTFVAGQRFTAEAMSLDNLITYAYDVKRYQLLGVPGWADSNNRDCDRYDVSAKAEGDGTLIQEQAKVMLRNLLIERFHLRFHRDMKEMPIYALTVAKSGHKLKDNTSDTEGVMKMTGGPDGIELTSTGGTIAFLINQLNANAVDRPVVDRTELGGNYDYKLTWTPDFGARRNDSEAVSIFTALP